MPPRSNAPGIDSDERAGFEIVVNILVVFFAQGCNARRVGILVGSTVHRSPTYLYPPELGPIFAIVVDDQCDARVIDDVSTPTEIRWRDALGFFVNRRHDVSVGESEANGNDVWSARSISRG